jgi:hypothetical protein
VLRFGGLRQLVAGLTATHNTHAHPPTHPPTPRAQGYKRVHISPWRRDAQLGHVRDTTFQAPIKGPFASWGVPHSQCHQSQVGGTPGCELCSAALPARPPRLQRPRRPAWAARSAAQLLPLD